MKIGWEEANRPLEVNQSSEETIKEEGGGEARVEGKEEKRERTDEGDAVEDKAATLQAGLVPSSKRGGRGGKPHPGRKMMLAKLTDKQPMRVEGEGRRGGRKGRKGPGAGGKGHGDAFDALVGAAAAQEVRREWHPAEVASRRGGRCAPGEPCFLPLFRCHGLCSPVQVTSNSYLDSILLSRPSLITALIAVSRLW